MPKQKRSLPVTIPIRTLSGGVGRQAPSKRLPTEAETLDNCLVTLERSVEKRSGFEFVNRNDEDYNGLDVVLGDDEHDYVFYWLSISDKLRYLTIVDFKASAGDTTLVQVYKLTSSGLSLVSVNNSTISASARAYITYGNTEKTAAESLKIINVGSNILILNKNVKAGYSSGENGKLFDLAGNETEDNDIAGRAGEYLTQAKVDPKGEAEPWTGYSLYLPGDFVIKDNKIYKSKKNISRPETGSNSFDANDWTFEYDAERIDVRDYRYPDPNKPQFGQAVTNISYLRFPPEEGDADGYNGEHAKLLANYPDIGNSEGKGKIYYFSQSFGAISPGFYRVKDETDRPYLHKILSPESSSVIDKNRMPHKLFINSSNNWEVTDIDWDPRTGGDNDSNPGPSFFRDDDEVRQMNLNAMAFYRDRLFLAGSDFVISSKMGDYTDFWIDNPGNIVATDPIDVQASTNKYTPITAMIPFADFLFINTDSDTQYELMGSENQITPFTAELSPTAFYSTAPLIDPQLMGSQIYFYSKNRMYIYFSTRIENINNAAEVSSHCPGYLPTNFRSPAVAPSRDSIFVVDDDNPNHIYVYTNRFSGDQVIQNAFSRFVLDNDVEIYNVQEFDDFLYILVSFPTTETGQNKKMYLLRMSFTAEDYNIPRIDMRNKFTVTETNTVYDSSTNVTTFTLPVADPHIVECILYSGFGEENYIRLSATRSDGTIRTTDVSVNGRYDTVGGVIYFGRPFDMTIELSPQFYRDSENNVVDGVLNMRNIHFRHANTGDYRVEVTRRNRTPLVSTFSPNIADERGTSLGLPLKTWENDGEFLAQVFGFNEETSIKIVSDYPTPCNITNIEIKAKFKPIHSSVLV